MRTESYVRDDQLLPVFQMNLPEGYLHHGRRITRLAAQWETAMELAGFRSVGTRQIENKG